MRKSVGKSSKLTVKVHQTKTSHILAVSGEKSVAIDADLMISHCVPAVSSGFSHRIFLVQEAGLRLLANLGENLPSFASQKVSKSWLEIFQAKGRALTGERKLGQWIGVMSNRA